MTTKSVNQELLNALLELREKVRKAQAKLNKKQLEKYNANNH